MANYHSVGRGIRVAFLVGLTGCTFHPPGEREQREAALQSGRPFEKRIEVRQLPPLPADPTPDQLVDYALLTNADLEQRFWEWRSAIEQIPQDGTPETTLAINAATSITRGRAALADTVLTAQNMPSMMIPRPGKLSAAARLRWRMPEQRGCAFAGRSLTCGQRC